MLRTLGNFLVLVCLYGVVATFGPVLWHEVRFQVIAARGIHYEVVEKTVSKPTVSNTANPPSNGGNANDVDDGVSFADIMYGEKKQVIVPVDSQFGIVIPKIGANAKVYPNVDPGNPEEFKKVLQTGIAHAKGSVFPGFSGNVYLFAHSTDNWWNVGRYNAVFYLLKDLTKGDEIVVFFEHERFDYVVTQSFVVSPEEVSLLTDAQKGGQQLILQTCWPPGTTWKRLIVVATPKLQ